MARKLTPQVKTEPKGTESTVVSAPQTSAQKGTTKKAVPIAPDEQTFVVFYSWQSDLADETNRRLIREALRDASSRLEAEFSERRLHLVIDEATRGEPGSPNIPQTIMEKIRGADAFVCDITTINEDRAKGRRAVPNPNVAIELGYAIAQVGWSRIVMLFNTAYGKFPDEAPFDIDRHRVSLYDFPQVRDDEQQLSKKKRAEIVRGRKQPLFELCYDALKPIIEQDPPRPSDVDKLSPEERKQRHDVVVLRSLMGSINVPRLDGFIEDVQVGKVHSTIFHFWETFDAIVSSSLFHIYDQRLSSAIEALHHSWGEIFSFSSYFTPMTGGGFHFFGKEGDLPLPLEEQKAFTEMQKCAAKTRSALSSLLRLVREEYVEVDVDELSAFAWREYVEFHQNFQKRLEEISSEN